MQTAVGWIAITLCAAALTFGPIVAKENRCQRVFIIVFDKNVSNLTSAAQQQVTRARVCARPSSHVVVVGHTRPAEAADAVSNDYATGERSERNVVQYARALSERRAQSVKDEMVRQGMDGAQIVTSATAGAYDADIHFELDRVSRAMKASQPEAVDADSERYAAIILE